MNERYQRDLSKASTECLSSKASKVGKASNLVVENKVIIELKAVTQLHDIHSSQLMTYLKLTGMPVGLILNFNMQHLKEGIRRHVRSRDPS
jgi:GxxExxY protein